MTAILFSALAALGGGLVMGVTGFGAGMVIMMVLPVFYSLTESAALTVIVSTVLNAQMAIRYWKHIHFKSLVAPTIAYMILCALLIRFSTEVDQSLIQKGFGVFLICLCIYYLFLQKDDHPHKKSLSLSILCIAFSAVFDSFFSIGGPLLVIYFMARTDSTKAYMGTIQAFFFINYAYSSVVRIINGILLPSHLAVTLVCSVAVLLGGVIAQKLVNRLDDQMVRKLIYIMIGVSGVLNLIK